MAFQLEDWLRQAGLEDDVIPSVAAKLREEEYTSLSALKKANDETLKSIGIKAGSRHLILDACAVYRDAPAASAAGQLTGALPGATAEDPYYVQRSKTSVNAAPGSFAYPVFPASRYIIFLLFCLLFSSLSIFLVATGLMASHAAQSTISVGPLAASTMMKSNARTSILLMAIMAQSTALSSRTRID